jgi:hypothetical protein
MRGLLALLVVMVAVVCAMNTPPVSACPASSRPASRPVDREAVAHLAAGNKAYKAATDKKHPISDDERQRRLQTAIDEYTAGQRCDDAFVFDFNLGQAYAALGRQREALEHLLRFRDRAELGDADRANVEKRIAAVDPTGKLRAERADSQAATKQASSVPTPTTAEITRTSAALHPSEAQSMPPAPGQTAARRPAPPEAPSPTTDSAPHSSVRWGRIAGWTLATAGLVGGGVTTYLVLDAQNLERQATDAEANQQASVRNKLTARAADRRRSATLFGVGSGIVLATGLLFALWPSSDRPPTQASWNFGITGSGIAVEGRF